MRIVSGGVFALCLVVLVNSQDPQARASCEGLASLALPHSAMTLAQAIGHPEKFVDSAYRSQHEMAVSLLLAGCKAYLEHGVVLNLVADHAG